MNKEFWLPVVGHEKTHEVSSLGKLRSIDRVMQSAWATRPSPRKGRPINTSTKGKYKNVHLGHGKSDLIHRIVARAFVPNPEGCHHVHHIDGNTKNNAASNLQWVSPSDHSRHHHTNGVAQGSVISTKSKVKEIVIRLLIEGKIQVNEAALICDVSRQTISTWLKTRIENIT